MRTITAVEPGRTTGRARDGRDHPQPGAPAGHGRRASLSPAQEAL